MKQTWLRAEAITVIILSHVACIEEVTGLNKCLAIMFNTCVNVRELPYNLIFFTY